MCPTKVTTMRKLVILVTTAVALVGLASAAHWDHAVDLDENYRLLWSINNQDITFEVQARTLGYVGLGFSTDGSIYGADIVIGWVDNGQVHFQGPGAKRRVVIVVAPSDPMRARRDFECGSMTRDYDERKSKGANLLHRRH
ncbi:hypothetical protein RP20_CCG015679 [Aedes albopictus]|nr:hypothetical protein RP20_CCG015679 [Aedes albopictus]